jgi:hypothetical protein
MVMNKLAYGFLLVFCLGYITNDFISESKLFTIAPAQASIDQKHHDELVRDYDFRIAVTNIVMQNCYLEHTQIKCNPH